MEANTQKESSRAGGKHWLRVLRPLAWWVILVLVLYGIRTHQRLSAQTRITFDVHLEGKPVEFPEATLDGRRVLSDQNVSIGWHKFLVTHAKANPFSTNLFVWYGEHNLGDIALKRAHGVLIVNAEPPVSRLSVLGPEFSTVLTNSDGMASPLPTDVYRVEAQWLNHVDSQRVTVSAGATNVLRLAPSLGTATLESDPSGAMVIGSDGRVLGTTPVTLRELHAGMWKGELRLPGYVPALVALSVTANQTNSVRTNLVNWQYAEAIKEARQQLAAGEFDRALDALAQALQIKPGDSAVTSLQRDATIQKHLSQAQALDQKGDAIAARKELESVLALAPDHAEAKRLLTGVREREQIQIQRQKQLAEEQLLREKEMAENRRRERLERPRKAFEDAVAHTEDAKLFGTHELKTSKSSSEVSRAIQNALETEKPTFNVWRNMSVGPETFRIEAKQDVSGGIRQCLIVVGQSKDDETEIRFKVMEFVSKHWVSIEGGLTFNTRYISLDPALLSVMSEKQSEQLKEGVQIVTQRIHHAISQ